MVRCGHCQQQHASADAVRTCAARHVAEGRPDDQGRAHERALLLARQTADRIEMDAVKEQRLLGPALRRFQEIYREMMPLELTEDQQERYLAAPLERREVLYRQWRAERVDALIAQKQQLERVRRQLESDDSQHQQYVDYLTPAEKSAYEKRLQPREYWPDHPYDDWREQE
jgi:hypothetical protein